MRREAMGLSDVGDDEVMNVSIHIHTHKSDNTDLFERKRLRLSQTCQW